MYQSQVFDYESMIGKVNLSMIKACGCNKDMYECIGIEKDELEVILNKNDSKLFSSTMISDMRNTVNKFVQAVNPFSLKEVTSDDLREFGIHLKNYRSFLRFFRGIVKVLLLIWRNLGFMISSPCILHKYDAIL